ncbi:hypothetical protein GCM10025868_22060 [Angustibacter aerolatus]|uniref:Uncharacterized protein n=1 Tax=Angustibacter aerolatus TaxID=1162965 RepID=A0ABQ6JHC3_9ACTN|nr:hypothetical protein GCM10025868_22060 [Angustibacter aerolatus]
MQEVVDQHLLGAEAARSAAVERGVEDTTGTVDAVVDRSGQGPAEQVVGQSPPFEHVDAAGFDDAGAVALLDVGPVASLQDDAVHAGAGEEGGEGETGDAGADDHDLRCHGRGVDIIHT